MKKVLIVILNMVFFISGCSFNAEVLTPLSPQTVATEVVQSEVTPLVTPDTVPVGLPVVGYTPTTLDPIFFGAYLSERQDDVTGTSIFPAGIEQIFAHWSYQNMREGLTIRREWHLDGQLWLTREEPWDYKKYGAFGWMSDVSIYDFDAGLPSGKYQLVIFINDTEQPIGKPIVEGTAEPHFEFEILSPVDATSPSGQWKATSMLDRIVLTDANGNRSDLVSGHEIISVTWLDDRRLLYVDRDRSGQVPNLLVGVRDTLWIVDLVTRETSLLYQSNTTLGSTGGLYPSPDGKYISAIEGTGFGDACLLDSKVIFFGIDNDYKNVNVIKQEEFAGLPVLIDQMLYPPMIGNWKSNTQYEIPLNKTCSSSPSQSDNYLFDLPSVSVSIQSVE